MTTKANVLELNGQAYDAITGLLLTDHPAHRAVKAIDGFINTPHHLPAKLAVHKPAPTSYKISTDHATHTGGRVFDIHRSSGHLAAAHHPQHATTLMRHAVHRPTMTLKRHTKVSARTDILARQPHFDVLPKLSISSIDQDRLKRAERIAKSKLVSRFGNYCDSAPVATHRQPPALVTRLAPAPPPTVKQPSDEVFERALAHANSHLQPAVKHKRLARKTHIRRISSVAAATLAVLLIAGFVAYQNAANIQLRIADSRAGINATLPKWQPVGFAVGKFNYSPGTVAINFKNSDGSRSFSLTQTASNWDSNTLFDNFVYPNSNSYETIQTTSKTIYTYDNNNATWVSNGIWYKLTSNGSLSTSQLVNLAASM